MVSWKRNLWLLWFGAFVTSASYSMIIPFLPLFLLKIGVHAHVETWSGLLFSITFLTGALISPYWGSLADRFGRKPMILRSGFSLCVLYILSSFVTNPYELLAIRALQGLLSGFIPNSIALIATNVPEEQVGYSLGLMATSTATGSIVGPLLGGVVSGWFGYRTTFAISGLIVLLSTLLVLFWVREDKFVPSAKRSSVWHDLKEASANRTFLFVFILTMLTACSIMTIEPILALYVVQLGGSVKNAPQISGIAFSLTGVASILFAPRWGKFADRAGFRKVLLIGLFGGALGTLAQLIVSGIWGFSIIRFLYGVFFCAVYPALNGLVVQTTATEFRGRAFGLNQSANQIGTMLGPMLGGVVAEAMGIHSVFMVTGGMLLITTIVAFITRNIGSTSNGTREMAHSDAN